MTERERRRERENPEGTGAGPESGEIRRRAQELGDDLLGTIERALSGDSEGFLRASRQQGGQ